MISILINGKMLLNLKPVGLGIKMLKSLVITRDSCYRNILVSLESYLYDENPYPWAPFY